MQSKKLLSQITANVSAFQDDYIEHDRGDPPLCYGLLASQQSPECAMCVVFKSCEALTKKASSDKRVQHTLIQSMLTRIGATNMAKKSVSKKPVKTAAKPKKGKPVEDDELELEDDDLFGEEDAEDEDEESEDEDDELELDDDEESEDEDEESEDEDEEEAEEDEGGDELATAVAELTETVNKMAADIAVIKKAILKKK